MQNTAPAITVYSKPACVQCTMTKKALDKKGLAYHEVDVTENAAALEYVTDLTWLRRWQFGEASAFRPAGMCFKGCCFTH